jgi:hypothetical protein
MLYENYKSNENLNLKEKLFLTELQNKLSYIDFLLHNGSKSTLLLEAQNIIKNWKDEI